MLLLYNHQNVVVAAVTYRRILLILGVYLLFHSMDVVVHGLVVEPSPVCKNMDMDSNNTASGCHHHDDDNDMEILSSSTAPWTCPIHDYNQGWIVSGRTVLRNHTIPGLISDIMIPFTQYTTRVFPRWGRHHYFFVNPNIMSSSTEPNQQQQQSYNHYIFAPGYKYPLECHKSYANLAVNYTDIFINAFPSSSSSIPHIPLNPPIRSDRIIAIGDPLFLPCYDKTLSAKEEYDDFPPLGMTSTTLDNEADECMNAHDIQIKVIDSMSSSSGSSSTPYYGTFTNHDIQRGMSVFWGRVAHMHRSELYNPLTKEYELLINYCYSPSNTSSLLLLPFVPGANTINHANRTKGQQPNVRIMWMDPKFHPQRFFTEPTEILFGAEEVPDERRPLMIEYVAIRDILAGDEILLDYGTEWDTAYQTHIEQHNGDSRTFRYPIGLPDDMIPSSWLTKEKVYQPPSSPEMVSHREWLTPDLRAGELQPMELSVIDHDDDTRQIHGMVDRVGLPPGLSNFLAKWADEIGITEVLRSHVRGELTLPPEGERRIRLNGTTWWVKRFPNDWQSDMHYISPDDFGSNQLFMEALSDAGFDMVLNSVGTRDNLTSITVYYPSYIAVSHCTRSLMHTDSDEDGHYNVIFPVLQVNNSKPELIVGDSSANIYVPYKYEPEHAVVLGKEGLHGTAPCDYRGTDSMRMVVSVYMVDGDNRPTRNKVIKDWIDADPPYPRVPDREHFIDTTKHWKKDDPTRTLRTPLAQNEILSNIEEE